MLLFFLMFLVFVRTFFDNDMQEKFSFVIMANTTLKKECMCLFSRNNMIFCSEQWGKRVFQIKIWHFKDSTCI